MNEPTRYGKDTNPKHDGLATRRSAELSLQTASHKPAAERDPDPYNSSGSFDRTKNWARIGKR